MKLLFTLFIFIISHYSISQIIKPLPDKMEELAEIELFITKDNKYLISTPTRSIIYDENGNLLSNSKVKKDESPYYFINGIRSSKSNYAIDKDDIRYSLGPKTSYNKKNESSLVILKLDPTTLKEQREIINYDDNIVASRNLASPILNDFSPYSQLTTFDSNGDIYNFSLFMSISEQSHPNLKSFEDLKFHTFLHIVKYSPKTEKIEISNALIDKIETKRKDGNTAFGEVIEIIDDKIIIKYTSFKSEENKGLENGIGDAKNYNITYWTVDLNTKEENKIYEYETNFPEKVEDKFIEDVVVNKKLYSDLAWTEKASDGNGFVSNHKILELDIEGEAVWSDFYIPESILRLNSHITANMEIKLGPENDVIMSNLITIRVSTHEYDAYNFVYSKNEDNKIELNTFLKDHRSFFEVKPIEIFSYKNIDDKIIKEFFEPINSREEIESKCNTCKPIDYGVVRLIGNEIKLFKLQNFSTSAKKFAPSIQIQSFPIGLQ